MKTIGRATSTLLVIDFQSRLMPAIADGAVTVANARRLLQAAALLEVPVLATEQNPDGLGHTVADLAAADLAIFAKMSFDAGRAPGFAGRLPADRPDLVVAGCEAHVCVLQTVLGLLAGGRRVFLVRDAIGARQAESKETALARMARHGAEIVTTEMVVFEWLETADHPRVREAVALIK